MLSLCQQRRKLAIVSVTGAEPQFRPREPRTRPWTKAEYYQMAEVGMFRDQRVELIGGEIDDASKDHGGRYANVTILKPGDSVTPLARPDLRIAVARFFA